MLLPVGVLRAEGELSGAHCILQELKQKAWSSQELGAELMVLKARGGRFWKGRLLAKASGWR